MNRTLIVTCPKEQGKRYFSKAQHDYENNLNISFNNTEIFENMNDAEEMLPFSQQRQIEMLMEVPNTLLLNYDIKFSGITEKETVKFIIDPTTNSMTTVFDRKHYVEGSENLSDEYEIKLQINNHVSYLDKEFHEGDNKRVQFVHPVICGNPINIKLESKKTFQDSEDVTYDQIEIRIE